MSADAGSVKVMSDVIDYETELIFSERSKRIERNVTLNVSNDEAIRSGIGSETKIRPMMCCSSCPFRIALLLLTVLLGTLPQ